MAEKKRMEKGRERLIDQLQANDENNTVGKKTMELVTSHSSEKIGKQIEIDRQVQMQRYIDMQLDVQTLRQKNSQLDKQADRQNRRQIQIYRYLNINKKINRKTDR